MVFHHKNPNQRKGGHVMKKVLKKGKRGNKKERLVVYEEMLNLDDSSSWIELIQMLIPVGLQANEEELQSEVMEVAGARYTRTHRNFKRWGCNDGSGPPYKKSSLS